jgi:hypothetical protein
MSPEQARFGGGLDVRADVYGLGALAYHLLTGRAPSTAPVAVVPSAIQPGLPPGTDEVVMRALEADRERRWPTAEEFATALDGLIAAVSAPAPSRSQAPGDRYAPSLGDAGSRDATVRDSSTGHRSIRGPGEEDHTVADPTTTDGPSTGYQTPSMPPTFEPSVRQQMGQEESPSERTVVDFPVGRPDLAAQGGAESPREVSAGGTLRGRVLVALGLAAVLVAGGGGAYGIAKLAGSGSGSPVKKRGDGFVGVTDTTGRLTLRVPAAWKLQTQQNKWPIQVSDIATAPALRATPDYAQFVRDDAAVPGVFAGLTRDLTVTLPPIGLGSHRARCTQGTDRPYRHGTLSGRITPWKCGGSITINEVGLRDAAGKYAMWVRVKLTAAPDITQKILDSIQVKG